MAGHTNLIEEAVQALDNGCDLLRQVGGVHDEPLAATSSKWLPYWRIMGCGMCAPRNEEALSGSSLDAAFVRRILLSLLFCCC